MSRMMRAWCKANSYVRSGQHEKAIYWFLRTQEILDAGPPRPSPLKGIDAGYMLGALFFLALRHERLNLHRNTELTVHGLVIPT
jgi:hypothetical protein